MASRFEEDVPEPRECGNCGEVEGLMRCSRCRSIWFCSAKCQKAYWPFHKSECRRNEFADAMEEQEPRFARWMRHHGKLAVLKDDEVERLERASKALTGPSRHEVMDSMYGRLDPKPKSPTYSPEEKRKMRVAAEQESHKALLCSKQDRSWQAIDIPRNMGLECFRYKWKQNQSYVELFIKVPENVDRRKVFVELKPKHIKIFWDEDAFMDSELRREIKQEDSTWFIENGILEIHMLKKSRKGFYADGETNADTFWPSILAKCLGDEKLKLQYPPTEYYWSPHEENELPMHQRLGNGRRIKRS